MPIINEDEILSSAIAHFGENAQVLKCIEELCELGIELCRSLESITETEEEINKTELQNELASAFYQIKNMDGNDYTLDKRRQTEVTSELADVSITTQQMLKIFTTPEEFEKVKQAKLSRLVERMNGDGDSQ
jgi:hypothetical protein